MSEIFLMKFTRLVFTLLAFLSLNLVPVHAQSERWESPETVTGAETIGLDQAVELHKQGVVFIDVRSARQFHKRHIPGAKHLFVNDGFSEASLLRYLADKNSPFVIYCNGINCSLSSKSAEMAVAWGFTQIKYFRSGIRAWRLSGNPVEYGAQR